MTSKIKRDVKWRSPALGGGPAVDLCFQALFRHHVDGPWLGVDRLAMAEGPDLGKFRAEQQNEGRIVEPDHDHGEGTRRPVCARGSPLADVNRYKSFTEGEQRVC